MFKSVKSTAAILSPVPWPSDKLATGISVLAEFHLHSFQVDCMWAALLEATDKEVSPASHLPTPRWVIQYPERYRMRLLRLWSSAKPTTLSSKPLLPILMLLSLFVVSTLVDPSLQSCVWCTLDQLFHCSSLPENSLKSISTEGKRLQNIHLL